ncbi:MAG: thioesterase family protein [Lachnospiraceae bacterium]|nr:thioesterase family protein [Lachnospiraceae bacterium]
MLEVGMTGHQELTVTEELTAKAMGSGELRVFATPAMLALMEKTAYQSVADALEEGSGSVGTMVQLSHSAASPVGMKVVCDSKLTAIDGRKLTFSIEARDESGVIGQATHERFIVYNDKFQAKADAKL